MSGCAGYRVGFALLWLVVAGTALGGGCSRGSTPTDPSGPADPTDPQAPYAGVFAVANGELICGNSKWMVAEGTLYLNNHAYYTLAEYRPRIQVDGISASDSIHDIITAATAAAQSAASREEWVERFTAALDALEGDVLLGYTVYENRIALRFHGVEAEGSVIIPVEYPVYSISEKTPEEILQYQMDWVNMRLGWGYMIFWGNGYPVHAVPPKWVGKTKDIMDAVANGVSPETMDLTNTPFRAWPQILDDFIRVNVRNK